MTISKATVVIFATQPIARPMGLSFGGSFTLANHGFPGVGGGQ